MCGRDVQLNIPTNRAGKDARDPGVIRADKDVRDPDKIKQLNGFW